MHYSLLHMVCQEGYYTMLQYMADPRNHSEFDQMEIDFSLKNVRGRSALFLCFTPPPATVSACRAITNRFNWILHLQFCGQHFGVDSEGNCLSEKPEEIENLSDWYIPFCCQARLIFISVIFFTIVINIMQGLSLAARVVGKIVFAFWSQKAPTWTSPTTTTSPVCTTPPCGVRPGYY